VIPNGNVSTTVKKTCVAEKMGGHASELRNINKSHLLSSHQSTTSLVHCHPRPPPKKLKRRNKQKNSLCQNQIYTAPYKPNALKFGLMDR
jgi:hypothetical protein